jgi:hypothetical protein
MHNYSLKDLFRDEQRHILRRIIAGTRQEFENKFISLYENSKSLMGFVRETGMPVPRYFMTTAETALNLKLQKMFTSETINLDRLKEDAGEIGSWQVEVDTVALEFIIRRRTEKTMAALLDEPDNAGLFSEVLVLLEAIMSIPVAVNLWQTQNMYWTMLQSRASEIRAGDADTADRETWSSAVVELGQLLFFNVPEIMAAAKGGI